MKYFDYFLLLLFLVFPGKLPLCSKSDYCILTEIRNEFFDLIG